MRDCAVGSLFRWGSLSYEAGVLALCEINIRLKVAVRLAACIADTRQPDQVQHSLADIIRSASCRISMIHSTPPMTTNSCGCSTPLTTKYGFQPIVVFDGEGRFVNALLPTAPAIEKWPPTCTV